MGHTSTTTTGTLLLYPTYDVREGVWRIRQFTTNVLRKRRRIERAEPSKYQPNSKVLTSFCSSTSSHTQRYTIRFPTDDTTILVILPSYVFTKCVDQIQDKSFHLGSWGLIEYLGVREWIFQRLGCTKPTIIYRTVAKGIQNRKLFRAPHNNRKQYLLRLVIIQTFFYCTD